MRQLIKNLKLVIGSIITLFILSSCEKVIDLELKVAAPVIVIDATLSNQHQNHFVRISKTLPFNKQTTFNGVKGAQVTLKSILGQSIAFTEVADGVYRSTRFRGNPGLTYTMEVISEGKTYSAQSTMPFPVFPDSVGFKTLSFFGNSNIFPIVYYNDPPKIQNQYRYILKVNNKIQDDLVFEDRFNDGNAVSDVIIFASILVQEEVPVVEIPHRNVRRYSVQDIFSQLIDIIQRVKQ
jgi:hypothetical protein